MTSHAELGLRERKRLATRRAIQVAVLDLAVDRGLDKVTIDEVSRVVDISPRTFFNYFATKEDAVVGDGVSLPPAQIVETFTTGSGDFLAELEALLVATAELSTEDLELSQRRKALLRNHPQLFARRMATMRGFEDELAVVVRERLIIDNPAVDPQSELLNERARLIAIVAFGTMRHAWTAWAREENSVTLADRVRSSFAHLGALLAPLASDEVPQNIG